jgi:predicted pyridoxine 5'-phosphate oxidase superfamily flavin-nucleotide-binding protein
MAYGFVDTLATPAVKALQEESGSRAMYEQTDAPRDFDRFTAQEAAFIAARDSFYSASVAENGWPYVQHRGGPPGFLKLLDGHTLAFADFRGNRQYLSAGNAISGGRVALFLMDYRNRRRLKILAHAELKGLSDDPALAARLVDQGYKARPERIWLLRLEAFDWNCPQHITPRYTEAEVQEATAPLLERLAALEAENAKLRAQSTSP